MSLAWRQKSFAGRHSDIRGFTHGIYPSEEPAANYFRPSFASKRAQAAVAAFLFTLLDFASKVSHAPASRIHSFRSGIRFFICILRHVATNRWIGLPGIP